MTDTVTLLSYYEPHTLQSNSACTAKLATKYSYCTVTIILGSQDVTIIMTSLFVSNVHGSEAAEQNNRAFCDKSIKFGTVVDNSTIMKYRYWATTEFSV